MATAATTGELSLPNLIKSMTPTLHPSTYVFVILPSSHPFLQLPNLLTEIQMLFCESEGWTIIITEQIATQHNLDFIFPSKKITLNVHSSLEAVGFLAAVTTRLAERLRVGVNPVSGYYHDHLFVPVGREEEVVRELEAMARGE